jgi:hypothetical protein
MKGEGTEGGKWGRLPCTGNEGGRVGRMRTGREKDGEGSKGGWRYRVDSGKAIDD